LSAAIAELFSAGGVCCAEGFWLLAVTGTKEQEELPKKSLPLLLMNNHLILITSKL